MAQDCFVIKATINELNSRLSEGRIDKIYMPSKDKIVISLRAKEGNIRLLLEAGNVGKVHITTQKTENPDTPPMLCMLFRKHLANGRIIKVDQPFFERMMVISVLAADEMGDVSEKKIYIEMMGRRNNIILCDSTGRIIGCLKKIDMDMMPDRPVLPGLIYTLPPLQDKVNLLDINEENICEILPKGEINRKMLTDRIGGLSPVISGEICYQNQVFGKSVENQLLELKNAVINNDLKPYVLKKEGESFDFSAINLSQYENQVEIEEYENFSLLLDDFYSKKAQEEQRKNISAELLKTMHNALDRQIRKLANQKNELITAQNREEIKKNADLIMSNIHLLKKGMKEAELTDYFEENLPIIKVALDELKTPQQNAQKLYDLYGRLKNAEAMLKVQIEKGEQEIIYIESVISSLENIQSSNDVLAIKDELYESGYLKNKAKNLKKVKKQKINPRKFISSEGFTILCGRNNIENDALTMKQADFRDVWFHARNVPGSHVILSLEGREATDKAIEESAQIAAFFSKMTNQPLASIDYTIVKYVKKIPGAKPGMVTYSNFKTVFVKPKIEIKEI